jgi:hypothetical protein
MSYILDALKKAEQKRQLAAKVPTLGTVHRKPATPRATLRVSPWPWIAGAVILVNVSIVTWLLWPSGQPADGTRPAPTIATAPAPAVPARPPETSSATPVAPPAPAP